jgi:hypothetical protein
MAIRSSVALVTPFDGVRIRASVGSSVARRVNLKGKPTREVPLKVVIPLERKRQMTDRAAGTSGPDGKPMDLSTWVRMVLYRELDKPSNG